MEGKRGLTGLSAKAERASAVWTTNSKKNSFGGRAAPGETGKGKHYGEVFAGRRNHIEDTNRPPVHSNPGVPW